MIIHINGWPGVGKKTIGKIVAKEIGARFIHNHVLHDVSLVCAGRGDQDFWPLYETVRSAAYEVLERKPKKEILVMTNAQCKTADREIVAWNHVVALAMKRGVPLVPIVLNAPFEELARRITQPARLDTKLKDAGLLAEMVTMHELLIPVTAETFQLDVGNLSAEESASEIVNYLSLNSESWNTATKEHCQFK